MDVGGAVRLSVAQENYMKAGWEIAVTISQIYSDLFMGMIRACRLPNTFEK